jgi:hypothetical protein
MPLNLADRVRDTTTTTGTGTVTLSGTAPTGYQNFSVIGNGNTTYYTINAGSQWEVGIGTYSSTGPTLSRDTVLASSNGNALVNFTAGIKDVFVTYPAGKSVTTDGVETLTNKTLDAVTLDSGYTEEIFAITDGASVDLDPSNGSIQTWALGASRSPTATGFGNGQSMTLMIDDGTAYSITWPSVTWVTDGGVAPTLNTSGFTTVVLWKVGGTLYGARVGDA